MDDMFDVMNELTKHEELLKAMGFTNEVHVREALKIAKNDINEAVSILTSERLPKSIGPSTKNDSNDNEVIMGNEPDSPNNTNKNMENSINDNPLFFPVDCLIKLENSIFTDSWSIPYKKDEWLDRLLKSAIALTKEGTSDIDLNCKKFIDKLIPEVFRKLLDSMPVKRWGPDIQEGVYNMTSLCIDLISLRLNQPFSILANEQLLNTLALIFNQDTTFQVKNMYKRWERENFSETLGDHAFTVDNVDKFGWLLNFINMFGITKGFDGLKLQLESASDLNEYNLLLKPIAMCAEFLNAEIMICMFEVSVKKVCDLINNLEGDDLKDKNLGKVFDLLHTLKKMVFSFWQAELNNFNAIHLNVVLKMLKYPHFNSKMNSLKEICKLIENSKSYTNSNSKISLSEENLTKWIVENRILSLAVEGNIDQSQYSEKLKTIVEFIAECITNEEISTLWSMQFNKSMSIVDNLYTIIGMAATRFNSDQLDFLIQQITKTWNDNAFKLHEKLVSFLRFIGCETKTHKIYNRILETLWELKNRPNLHRNLLLFIYNEHLNVLVSGNRENAKSFYLRNCCEEIKTRPGSSIAIASLRHIHDILCSYQKTSSKALKDVLENLVLPMLKGLITSLSECQTNAYNRAKLLNQKFDHTILVDDIFTHEEVVNTTLNCIRFILQESNVYLHLSRAREIWDILINNENSCEWDRDVGFGWFIDCSHDLSAETKAELFKNQILSLDTSKLTSIKGYECFKLYFIRVNENEGKIHILSQHNDIDNFVVEKFDLTGLNFLWDIILGCSNEAIVSISIKLLLEVSYDKTSSRLRKEIMLLHQRFINECYSRLEKCLITLDKTNPISQLLLNSFSIAANSIHIQEIDQLMRTTHINSRPMKYKFIERILLVAEKYVLSVEEYIYSSNRFHQPHYLTFKAESFPLTVMIQEKNVCFEIFPCSNETLGDLRTRISNYIHNNNLAMSSNVPTTTTSNNNYEFGNTSYFSYSNNNVYQIYLPSDKLLSQSNDYKTLSSLGINGMENLILKQANTYPNSQTPIKDSAISNFHSNYNNKYGGVNLDQEKCLPSYIISSNQSSFDMFAQLEDLNEPNIKTRIKNILNIIPTNPKLLESFDQSISKASTASNSSKTASNNLVKSPSASNLSQSQSSIHLLSQSTPNTPTFLKPNFSLTTTPTKSAMTSATAYTNIGQKVSASALTAATLRSRLNTATAVSDSHFSTETGLSKYFDKSTHSLNRILYNLEALSSRLMPSTSVQDVLNSDLYQQEFLKQNGLSILVSLLKLEPCASPNDYEIKQDIYLLLLQLLRLLFFGSYVPLNSVNYSNKRPSTSDLMSSSCCSPKRSMFQDDNKQQQHLSIEESPQKSTGGNSSKSISTQSLISRFDMIELKELIVQLLVLFWSASAGNIELTILDENLNQEVANTSSGSNNARKESTGGGGGKEVKFFIPYEEQQNKRLSTGSDSNSQQMLLQSGICLKKKGPISVKDIKIAYKSVELISCFLQYRKDCLLSLFSMKLFNDCLLDVLTGSMSVQIRTYTEQFLFKLNQIDICKEFLINLIINARLPLWVNSSLTRSSNQRLITQSSQYFNLRCLILDCMSSSDQQKFSIDIAKMLGDQIAWFKNFTSTQSLQKIDNCLLSGHLNLTKSLLTCETADKERIGNKLIDTIIKTFLFPAANLLHYHDPELNMDAICSEEFSRIAAYNILVELSRNCIKNYRTIKERLVRLHHNSNRISTEWNVIPLVVPKAACGYVGLKNAGATCYMNAVLQQLFMIPGVCEYLLSIDDQLDCINRETSVFWQLQNVFAHLKESKLQYCIPEAFWKAFRMWGQEINVREQQDAFDFFISLTDQIDEYLKKISCDPVFKHVFEGTFSNQFICKDCPHSYEREEVFLGLNLPVKSGNLQESLAQFVKDELLDGDNSYNCEKCNEKRSAIKRTCIKRLPKYMCIQLKRFDYDWESNRSLKFDDYFQFPRQLNVSPYTYESINKTRINNSKNIASTTSDIEQMDINNSEIQTQLTQQKDIVYELVGIVVHSGQANAGHYYSFIKGSVALEFSLSQEIRELEQLNQSTESNELNTSSHRTSDNNNTNNCSNEYNPNDNWYKFNDTSVEEINLNDVTLMEECFGGTFVQQASDFKMLPEERVRYWNGYMLFYREANFNINELKQKQTENNVVKSSNSNKRKQDILTSDTYNLSRDSLSELTELVSKGDEKGIFRIGLPPAIEQIVRSENLEFCKNRSVYDKDYFNFIYDMIRIFKDINGGCDGNNHNEVFSGFNNQIRISAEEQEEFYGEASSLGLEFLFNTYFKTGKKLRTNLQKWMDLFKEMFINSRQALLAMLSFVNNRESNSNFIRHFILECSIIEIRKSSADLFECFLSGLVTRFHVNPLNEPAMNKFITNFVALLDKAVIDLTKSSYEYFEVLCAYANMSKESAQHLITLGLFNKLFCFLLGNPSQMKQDDLNNRRWTSSQLKDFGRPLFELISSLVLKCNILSLKTCEIPSTADNAQPMNALQSSCKTDIVSLANLEEMISDTAECDNGPIRSIDRDEDLSPKKLKEHWLKTQRSSETLVAAEPVKLVASLSIRAAFSPPVFSEEKLQVPQEVQIYLFGALSGKFLKELVYSIEHIEPTPLKNTLCMILQCCYCNETFSDNIIIQILTHITNSLSNEFKQGLALLNEIILIDDPLQVKRLDFALNGNILFTNGLLNIIRQNQQSDAKKSYHCVKFIVKLSNRNNSCKDYLLKTANNWEWSVNWLKTKMTDSGSMSSQTTGFMNWSSSNYQSNEDSAIKTFQRTKSAQRTLDDATALLKSSDIELNI